jgi:small GTP-binding protein
MEKNEIDQNNNSSNQNVNEIIKLIIIGSVSVGKTSLLLRYATGKFQNVSKSTSTASYITKIKQANNKTYEIRLWDTAGQEKYRSLTKIFIKDAKIAILVYAIDDENSFKDLDMWLNIVKDINNENIILGIAANKADLYSTAKVTDEQGKNYAEKIGASWSSTSSLIDDNGIDGLVDELFKQYVTSGRNRGKSENKGVILSNKNLDENEKGGGCCSGKKDKKKNKKKKISESIENNEKYNEDEF